MNRTLFQTYVAWRMALAQSLRELGALLAFLIVFPLGFLFFLGLIVKTTLLPQVLVGSLMMELGLININVLAQSIGGDKQSKVYDLWVSLPISPLVYVLALALSLLPFSLLSAVVTLVVGIYLFGIPIALGLVPLLFLGFLLVWASTLGIGFLIGVYGSSPRQISTLAQFVGIVMTFFAPVFYPVSLLPPALRLVAYVWPLTWGAQLFASLLAGDPGALVASGAVLTGFTVAWFALIAVGLRWRQR
ncbi:MAG TPA: ABC transporter permease [Thermoplasmata archaeon]